MTKSMPKAGHCNRVVSASVFLSRRPHRTNALLPIRWVSDA